MFDTGINEMFSSLQPLYARIKEIGWPKCVEKRNCEILEDGSVRITSQDEFGSLILSSHHRDFTVCYLSLLSQEKVKNRHKHEKVKGTNISLSCQKSNNQPDTSKQSNHSSQPEKSYDSPRANKTKDDLNISPITQASCADSPRALSNASGSPITPLDVVKDTEAKFRPFSTPTEELEAEPVCTPYGKTAVFKDYSHKSKGEKVRFENDSFEKLTERGSSKTDKTLTEMCNRNNDGKESTGHVTVAIKGHETNVVSKNYNTKANGCEAVPNAPNTLKQINHSADSGNRSGHNETNSSTDSSVSDVDKPSPRCNYCWVTRHISCDECPLMWSHVVKLAKNVAENGIPDVADPLGKITYIKHVV